MTLSAQFIPGLFPSTIRPIYLVFIWVTECFVRVFFRVNFLLHWLHLNSSSPVCPNVSVQIRSVSANVVTLVALTWFLTSVRHNMSLQTWCLCTGIFTLITLMRFLTSMCLHVSPQMWCQCASVFTSVTPMRLLTSMCLHVFSQLIEWGGGIVALLATVWLFSCMLPHHMYS